MDEIKKKITFYRGYLIPKLKSRGDAGYKSEQIAAHLEGFIDLVEQELFNQPKAHEPEATPEAATQIFKN